MCVVINTNFSDNPYENLQYAVIQCAIQDFKKYCRGMVRELCIKEDERESEIFYFRAEDTLNWFLSKDFEMIGLHNGKDFKNLLIKEMTPEELSIYNYWRNKHNEN